MRYLKLTIAYDGTDFHGWQMQSGKPTVQGEIVSVLRRLTQENIALHAAGRTDAGVHALGQVGSFRTQSALSAQEFQRALNAILPPTIRIAAAEEVGPDFSARWSARSKIYRYRLYRGKVVPPMLWRYVLHYPFPLNEDKMRDASPDCRIYQRKRIDGVVPEVGHRVCNRLGHHGRCGKMHDRVDAMCGDQPRYKVRVSGIADDERRLV